MDAELERKVSRAVRLLRHWQGPGPIEVAYSGGKDSDAVLELVRMAGVPHRAIYKNTTIDPPGTVAHVRGRGAEVLNPRRTFLELVSEKGFPSRWRRWCCSELKEYKVLDASVQGIRRGESAARARRYREPVACRLYGGGGRVQVFLPILDWTEADVAAFLGWRGVRCHPLYYDADGTFHPERRLGCMACPLRTDNGVGGYEAHPKLLRAVVRAGARWFYDPRRRLKSRGKYGTVWDCMYARLFCRTYVDYLEQKHTLFYDLDCKAWLEGRFGVDLSLDGLDVGGRDIRDVIDEQQFMIND